MFGQAVENIRGVVEECEAAAGTVRTLSGRDVTIAGSGDHLTVDGAPVLCVDIPTGNATVFVIGKVLTP
jgi:uncharacterized surface protein with fasciclin (FAS1) repeats